MERGFHPRWSATFHTVGSREKAGFVCLTTDVNQDTFPPPCQICFLLRLYRHIPSVSTVRSISIRHLSANLLSSCHLSFIKLRTCRTVVPGAKSREAAAEKDPKSSGHNEKDGEKWWQKERRQRRIMTADSLTGLTHKWESHWWSAGISGRLDIVDTREFMLGLDAPHLWDKCKNTMPCQSAQITMVMSFAQIPADKYTQCTELALHFIDAWLYIICQWGSGTFQCWVLWMANRFSCRWPILWT